MVFLKVFKTFESNKGKKCGGWTLDPPPPPLLLWYVPPEISTHFYLNPKSKQNKYSDMSMEV